MIYMKKEKLAVLAKERDLKAFEELGFKRSKAARESADSHLSVFRGKKDSFITGIIRGEDMPAFVKLGFVVTTDRLTKGAKNDNSEGTGPASAEA